MASSVFPKVRNTEGNCKGRMPAKAILLSLISASTSQPAEAASNGTLNGRSQGTVSIRVSVAPKVWRTDAETVCLTLPVRSYHLRGGSADTAVSMQDLPASVCQTSTSRVHAVRLTGETHSTVIVVPE